VADGEEENQRVTPRLRMAALKALASNDPDRTALVTPICWITVVAI
jgi:hypothetical protein